jgi:hypothetical protein
MSTAIGRGRIGTVTAIAGLMAAVANSIHLNNNIRLEAPAAEKLVRVTPIKMPGMSPATYFRARAKAGRPRRQKNRFHCARKAKVARRR